MIFVCYLQVAHVSVQNDTTMQKNSMNLVNVSLLTNINKSLEILLDSNLTSKFYTMCAHFC